MSNSIMLEKCILLNKKKHKKLNLNGFTFCSYELCSLFVFCVCRPANNWPCCCFLLALKEFHLSQHGAPAGVSSSCSITEEGWDSLRYLLISSNETVLQCPWCWGASWTQLTNVNVCQLFQSCEGHKVHFYIYHHHHHHHRYCYWKLFIMLYNIYHSLVSNHLTRPA